LYEFSLAIYTRDNLHW